MTDQINPLAQDRRDFLKKLGLTSVAAAGISLTSCSDLLPTDKQGVHYGMLIDTRRCIGCHACSVACRSEYNVPLGFERSWVVDTEKGNYPNATVKFLPSLCNQCSEPKCVSVCPVDATYKRDSDGIVFIDEDICIGCEACIPECPYDVRFLNPDKGVVEKCDFCMERVSQGLEPSCVETCFQRARVFGDLNDPASEIARLIVSNSVSVYKQEAGTKPNVFYIDADYADEQDARYKGDYIRVTTHRRMNENL